MSSLLAQQEVSWWPTALWHNDQISESCREKVRTVFLWKVHWRLLGAASACSCPVVATVCRIKRNVTKLPKPGNQVSANLNTALVATVYTESPTSSDPLA